MKYSGFIEIFVAFAVLSYFSMLFSLNHPPTSDSATFADIVKHMSHTNQIHSTHPHMLDTAQANMPIFYPQLFFVEGAVLNLFIGKISFRLLPSLSVALLALGVYILTRRILGRRNAVLAFVISLGSNHLMFSGVRFEQEATLNFLMIIFLHCFLRLVSSRGKNWVVVGGIILAGAIGMKQQWIFLIISVIIALAVRSFLEKRQKYKHTIINSLMLLCIAGALGSPVLFYQFYTTGTLFYPGGTPQPIIEIEETFAKILGIQKYQLNPAWTKYAGGSGWHSSRVENAKRPTYIMDNISPINSPKAEPYLRGFFILFLTLSLISILKKRPWELIALLSLIQIMISIYVFLIPIWSYFLMAIPLTTIILAFGISTTLESPKLIAKKIAPLIIMSLICAIVISGAYSYNNLQQKSLEARMKMEEYDEMGAWIRNNIPENGVILTSRTTEIGYRSDRKAIWLTPLDGTEIYEAFNSGNETQLIKTMIKYDISYVLITKWWTGNPEIWPGYMSLKGARVVITSNHFKEVYRTEQVWLYELRRNE